MANRKHVNHGSVRKKKQSLSLAGTGAQTASFSMRSGEILEVNTDACTATTLTLSLTDLYDGASLIIDYDSNVACDTLTIQADDGVGDTILASGSLDDNARNHIRIDVLKADSGAAEISVIYTTIA